MYNNNRGGDRRGGNRSDHRGSGRRDFGGRDNRRSEMHDAVCADCGNNCKIPFFPRSGKPVYCSDCFDQRGNDSQGSRRDNGRSNDRNDRRPSFSKPRNERPQVNYKEQFEIVNAKLDRILMFVEANGGIKTPTKDKTKSVISETIEASDITEAPKKKKEKVKTVADIIANAVNVEK